MTTTQTTHTATEITGRWIDDGDTVTLWFDLPTTTTAGVRWSNGQTECWSIIEANTDAYDGAADTFTILNEFPVVDDTGECQCDGHRDLRTFDAS